MLVARPVVCALSLAILGVAGCAAPVDEPVVVGESRVPIVYPLPATPYVEWQFFNCLDNDHRIGLTLAMQDLANRDPSIRSALGGTAVGLSQCIGGEERGAIFSSADWRSQPRALTGVSIRPSNKAYAFATTAPLIAAVTNYEFSLLPKRFGDDGKPSDTGRYVVASLTTQYAGEAQLKILDTIYGVNDDVYLWTQVLPIGEPGPPTESYVSQYPMSSDDPLIEGTILATSRFIKNGYLLVDEYGGPSLAMETLALDEEPTLQGWALPFDDSGFVGDDFVETGGTIIF